MNEKKLPVNEETLSALFNGLGAVVFATVRTLPKARRAAFAKELESIAVHEEADGNTAVAGMLRSLHHAAKIAAG